MRLTDKEMKLSNLEYSVNYGVMVGEVVLFRLNSNINNAQTKILYKEIIRRINAFEEGGLVDELKLACEELAELSKEMYLVNDQDTRDKFARVVIMAEAALAKS